MEISFHGVVPAVHCDSDQRYDPCNRENNHMLLWKMFIHMSQALGMKRDQIQVLRQEDDDDDDGGEVGGKTSSEAGT